MQQRQLDRTTSFFLSMLTSDIDKAAGLTCRRQLPPSRPSARPSAAPKLAVHTKHSSIKSPEGGAQSNSARSLLPVLPWINYTPRSDRTHTVFPWNTHRVPVEYTTCSDGAHTVFPWSKYTPCSHGIRTQMLSAMRYRTPPFLAYNNKPTDKSTSNTWGARTKQAQSYQSNRHCDHLPHMFSSATQQHWAPMSNHPVQVGSGGGR